MATSAPRQVLLVLGARGAQLGVLLADGGGVPDVLGGEASGSLGVAVLDGPPDPGVVVLQGVGVLGGPDRGRRGETHPQGLDVLQDQRRGALVDREVEALVEPVTRDTAREMIDEVKGLAPLKGHRGAPPGDVEALVGVVVAVSELARHEPDVLEAEVNPVAVGRIGVTALDALVRRVGSVDRGR